MNVIDYVREEVTRQYHDVTQLDGIQRVGWMLEAWSFALSQSIQFDRKPDLYITETLGTLIEKHRNAQGFRNCIVFIGGNQPPKPEDLNRLLVALFEQRDKLTPLEFYKAFEEIHPFADGNGRTGKILLNWLNGTLLDPIFPPANLWGRAIRNP